MLCVLVWTWVIVDIDMVGVYPSCFCLFVLFVFCWFFVCITNPCYQTEARWQIGWLYLCIANRRYKIVLEYRESDVCNVIKARPLIYKSRVSLLLIFFFNKSFKITRRQDIMNQLKLFVQCIFMSLISVYWQIIMLVTKQ